MSMNPQQFRELIVRPVLQYLSAEIPYSEEAEDLLCMTAAHESLLGTYIKQVNGPALGYYQMETATHNDIWDNFLYYELGLTVFILNTASFWRDSDSDELVSNLAYATAMARVHYWRVPEPLPKKTDEDYLYALASYAKYFWNTHLGKAKATDYYQAYMKYYGDTEQS